MVKTLATTVALLALAGCGGGGSTAHGGGGNNPPSEPSTKVKPRPGGLPANAWVIVRQEARGGGNIAVVRQNARSPGNARVVVHQDARSESPSGRLNLSLRAPLPPIYLRVSTNPPARINLNGRVLCRDIDTGASVSSDIDAADEHGQLEMAVPHPPGAKPGWDCHVSIDFAASTDAGHTTSATAELLVAR
jgi:hypothetical protein